MQLAIDRGNTFAKFGVFDNDELVEACRCDNPDVAFVEALLNKYSIDKGILSSVKDIPLELIEFLKSRISLYEMSHNLKMPIKISYSTPETLGLDRISAVVGAYVSYGMQNRSSLLVIDAGTCITCNYVTADAEYLGGSISPGISMRFKALHQFTGRLPIVEQGEEASLIGQSTRDSILSGVLNGVVAEVAGLINSYKEYNQNIAVIVTGGDASFFAKKINNIDFADENLVLKGLKFIMNNND